VYISALRVFLDGGAFTIGQAAQRAHKENADPPLSSFFNTKEILRFLIK
jgi:hypothetical protein